MVRRVRDFPFTRQYINTTPYLYHIRQLATWGLGWPLGVVAWGGLLFTLAASWRRPTHLLLLSWVIPYFLIVGSFQVKFLRYLLPMTPLLAIMGANLLLSWHDRWQPGRKLARVAVVLVLAWALFYALAYLSIYSTPHPAVQVSRWIQANVSRGALILKEHWEESLPGLSSYQQRELPLYDVDNKAKARLIAEELAQADYLVFYSNRLYGTIPRLEKRYPITSSSSRGSSALTWPPPPFPIPASWGSPSRTRPSAAPASPSPRAWPPLVRPSPSTSVTPMRASLFMTIPR
jgi:hypothetical protein